jgi:dTDP-glucose 4,6-dehydratase
MKKNILVTGGAGFIGSHLVRRFVNKYPEYQIINFDCLTYAGNLENLVDIEAKDNYQFIKGNICNFSELVSLFEKYSIHSVIHLAAESHVDRSISNPIDFVMTNVVGTVNLLNAYKQFGDVLSGRFYHVSTDEVYGSLGSEGKFTEETPYDPNSPYSASKASSDHFVRAYGETFKLPFVISNCSNNYGSHQFPEKLIPLMINNIKQNKPLPVYGTGSNVRDWLWVEDHAAAIDEIFHNGEIGNTYNVGGNNEWDNLSLVKKLCDIMDEKLNRPIGTSAQLIHFVTDRAGHDFRYAIDASKLESELGWKPTINFDEGFRSTIDWYLKNEDWLSKVTSGTYQDYYLNMYSKEKL